MGGHRVQCGLGCWAERLPRGSGLAVHCPGLGAEVMMGSLSRRLPAGRIALIAPLIGVLCGTARSAKHTKPTGVRAPDCIPLLLPNDVTTRAGVQSLAHHPPDV